MPSNVHAGRLARPQNWRLFLIHHPCLLRLPGEVGTLRQDVVRPLRRVELLEPLRQLEAPLRIGPLELPHILLSLLLIPDSVLPQFGDLDRLPEEDAAVLAEAEPVLDQALVDVEVLDLVSFHESHAGCDQCLLVLSEGFHFNY